VSGTTKQSVRFSYIKSTFFRVLHVDGAIGGVTPQGFIHCALYNERQAIPQLTEHDVVGTKLGEATRTEGRAGFVREVEADLMMSRSVASELRDWLTRQIEMFDKLKKEAEGHGRCANDF
jgi:hypothetical protein